MPALAGECHAVFESHPSPRLFVFRRITTGCSDTRSRAITVPVAQIPCETANPGQTGHRIGIGVWGCVGVGRASLVMRARSSKPWPRQECTKAAQQAAARRDECCLNGGGILVRIISGSEGETDGRSVKWSALGVVRVVGHKMRHRESGAWEEEE